MVIKPMDSKKTYGNIAAYKETTDKVKICALKSQTSIADFTRYIVDEYINNRPQLKKCVEDFNKEA